MGTRKGSLLESFRFAVTRFNDVLGAARAEKRLRPISDLLGEIHLISVLGISGICIIPSPPSLPSSPCM